MHWASRPWVFWATASLVVLGVAAIVCRDPAIPASAPPPAGALVDMQAVIPPQPRQERGLQETGPGEAAATEAALLGADDWIAEVQTHSPDWRTATVKIGPPQSAWLMAISLQWDAGARCYDVVAEEELPYP